MQKDVGTLVLAYHVVERQQTHNVRNIQEVDSTLVPVNVIIQSTHSHHSLRFFTPIL